MKTKTNLLLIFCCIFAVQIPGVCADNPEQLVAAHLKSIGEPAVLSQVKSICFTGTSQVHFIQGMHGQLSGTSRFASEGNKMGIVMTFSHLDYPGEHFGHDGRNVTVNNMQHGTKSPLADFIHRYNKIMKNGMLGGVLSNSWPLLDIKTNRPTMRGLRKTKVDGAELYELEYRPRDNHGDMRIRLYFDPATYQHVRSEYRVSNRIGERDIFDTLTEKFEDFRKVGDLMLPHSYTLGYAADGAQTVFIGNWKLEVRDWKLDAPDIDQSIFRAENK